MDFIKIPLEEDLQGHQFLVLPTLFWHQLNAEHKRLINESNIYVVEFQISTKRRNNNESAFNAQSM